MLAAVRDADASVLVLLSGADYTAREFEEFTSMDSEWRRAIARTNFRIEELSMADHTLSRPVDGQRSIELTLNLLGALPAPHLASGRI